MGSYGYVGQYQQMPTVAGGGIIKADYWGGWDEESLPPFDLIIASLDPAYTNKQENDFSACTIWGVYKDKGNISRALMLFAWEERLEFHELVEKCRKTIKAYKVDRMLVEAKASGLSVIQELDRLLRNTSCSVERVDPKFDKIARAHSIAPVFEAGYIFAPNFDWAQKVIFQCADFPKSSHDDLVDSVTQAVRYLRDNVLETREDREVAMDRELTYNKLRQSRHEHGI
jgi:predicted phage terminase large subunit-like protein